MNRTHHQVWKGAQLQEAVVQLSQAESESSQTRRVAATHGIWVAADGKVRSGALQDNGADAGLAANMLHSTTHVRAQLRAERIEMLRVIELDDHLRIAQQELYERALYIRSCLQRRGLHHRRDGSTGAFVLVES